MTRHEGPPVDPTRESVALTISRQIALGVIHLVFKLRVSGLEHLPRHGPVLVAGNHSGFLDGPLVFIVTPRPSAFLVKSELYDGPFRRVLSFARQIPIRRGAPDRTALRQALSVLAGGGVLGVFPEGTRGTGSLESIQHGIGYLALHGDCPIVPVVCLGTAEALPKGRALPRWRTPIHVVIGAPFTVTAHGDLRARRTIADAAEQVRAGLLAHLADAAPSPAAIRRSA